MPAGKTWTSQLKKKENLPFLTFGSIGAPVDGTMTTPLARRVFLSPRVKC